MKWGKFSKKGGIPKGFGKVKGDGIGREMGGGVIYV